jgi:Family of unknown function (DUF5519)
MKPGIRDVLIDMRGAGEQIRRSVMSWTGVEAVAHRFGGTEYRYGRKEMGHVHGDRLADLPLPRRLHDEVIADGRAKPHHVLPDTGWVSCWIERPEDVTTVIELLRLQYERYRAAAAKSDSARGSAVRTDHQTSGR